MRINIGSSYPLFPRTGYVRYQGEGVTWRESDLENWNLYFTFHGAGEIRFGDGEMHTAQGELLLLPPHLDRSYRVAAPGLGWGFYFLHFRPTRTIRKALPWFVQMRPQAFAVADPTMQNRITATLEEMFQINLRNPEIRHRALLLDALVETVLLRVASVQGGVKIAGGGVDLRIEKAIERFHNDIGTRHSIDDLARTAGLSRSQFCLLFRAGMGCSLQEYMEERRLELARFYLMTTAHSVSEIAANVGYEDPFYFSTRFKRRFESSPSAFRHAKARERGIRIWTPALRGASTSPRPEVLGESAGGRR